MKTTVVHCKKDKYDIYIGRPSKWGNPFSISRTRDRATVIDMYEEWLLKQPELLKDIPTLRGKILGCWCKPNNCHGDILAEMADSKD